MTPVETVAPNTDMANARRFARDHGDDVRFVHERQSWFDWSGKLWQPDASGEVMRRAKRTVSKMYDRAAEQYKLAGESDRDGKARAEAALRWAKASMGRNRLEAMLALAKSEPGIGVKLDAFDPLPESSWLFNTISGTLDLRSGELREHKREDMLTGICGTPYRPLEDCPAFLAALDAIFAHDADLIDFFRQLMGYAITGDTSIHLLPVLWGNGSNGKSLLVDLLRSVIGDDYSGTAAPDLIMSKRGSSHPTERADLRGKRLVVGVETGEGKRLDESTMKMLTGGDRVKARGMKENFWEFVPTHKIFLVSNHKPKIREGGDSVWRRLRLVPFDVKFWQASRGESGPAELEADPLLKEKLLAEAPGILAWIVTGTRDLLRNGRCLPYPPAVRAATDAYQAGEDAVGRFVAERCVRDKHSNVKASEVYGDYVKWCEEEGESERPFTKTAFGSRLGAMGFTAKKSGSHKWFGLRLRNAFDPELDTLDVLDPKNELAGDFIPFPESQAEIEGQHVQHVRHPVYEEMNS